MDPNQYANGYAYNDPQQPQQQQQYDYNYGYGYDYSQQGYEGHDYSQSQYQGDQYYYDEQGNYYDPATYAGADPSSSSAAYYNHPAASTPSASKNKSIPSDDAAASPQPRMDGLTSAQRKKIAYYQYHGEAIPHHSTSGYTREDALGLPPASPSTAGGKMASKKKDKATLVRQAAGETWEDSSLGDWDQNDFRLFAGDLGNEVTDEILYNAFAKYPSIQKTRVVRDKRSGKSKGFGFISFKNADDFVKAWREMNGKYVGNRPVKLRKSTWKDRNMETKMKKEKDRTPYTKRR